VGWVSAAGHSVDVCSSRCRVLIWLQRWRLPAIPPRYPVRLIRAVRLIRLGRMVGLSRAVRPGRAWVSWWIG